MLLCLQQIRMPFRQAQRAGTCIAFGEENDLKALLKSTWFMRCVETKGKPLRFEVGQVHSRGYLLWEIILETSNNSRAKLRCPWWDAMMIRFWTGLCLLGAAPKAFEL